MSRRGSVLAGPAAVAISRYAGDMKVFACLSVALLMVLAACTRAPAPVARSAADAPSPRDWSLPVTAAAQPDLVRAPDGTLLLSWLAREGDDHALRFARWRNGGWTAPLTIARGDDWFVNWADTPHIAATADGTLWAHWLQKSAAAGYAYDVVLVRSADDGATWSTPQRVNDDGTATEHGFVSLWAASDDSLGVAWLDGRRMLAAGAAPGGHDTHDAHGGGAMTLRSARFDAQLQRSGEQELDLFTCDCCQTDVATTTDGALLVYRDRTEDEIRDIAAARLDASGWQAPVAVHADQWKMPACPVNGPALAVQGSHAAVAWYTAPDGVPQLRLSQSVDGGRSFAAPMIVASGESMLGRVALTRTPDAVWVAWLQEDEVGQSLQLARYRADLRQREAQWQVARMQGRGRGTGFPQMVAAGGVVYLVWTDVVNGAPVLQGAQVVR